MSKYQQTEGTKVRKDEVDAHHTSFQQDKHYSYSRASQQGSKILDNVNKALQNENNKSQDKDILDLIDGSFHDSTEQVADNKHHQKEGEQQPPSENHQDAHVGQQEQSIKNEEQNQDKNNETQQQQESNLKASSRLLEFFKKAPDSVQQSSKESASQFMSSLVQKNKSGHEKRQELQEPKTGADEQEEQEIDVDEFTNMEDQQDQMQEENQQQKKKKKHQEGSKINNPQDFGNISEIQEKMNVRGNNDESAQDVDLEDLLNNPNKKKHDEQILSKSQLENISKSRANAVSPTPAAAHTPAATERSRKNNEIQNQSHGDMKQSMRNASQSLSPRQSQGMTEEKRKKIEDAQRKKKDLEEELLAIQSEIAQINIAAEEKKKKENVYVKYAEISEDKSAQEHALNLIKKMNLARKEKEIKQQKEREMFNRQLQDDIKESHERQLRVKEKLANEKKDKIQQKLDQMHMRSEERKIINKQSNQIIKEIKKDLYTNDPDERYKQEVELPELEKRKKELAEKRKLYKPIAIEEIREHAKKHDEEIKIRKLQAKTNVLAEYNSLEADANKYNYPKTSALIKVLEDDKFSKMKDIIEMQKKKEQIERRKEYAKLVKEVHVPRVKPRPNLENIDNQQLYEDINQQTQSSQVQSHNIIRTPNNVSNQQVFRVKRKVGGGGAINNNNGTGFSSNSNLSPVNKQVRVTRLQQNSIKYPNQSRSQGRDLVREQQAHDHNQDQMNDDYNRTEELPNQNSLYNPGYDENIEQNHLENNRGSMFAGKSSYSSNSAQNRPVKQQKVFKPAAIEEPPKPAQKKYQNDYIKELRKQREDQEKKNGKKSKLEDWEKYKYDPNLSNNEKYKFILQSATRLEHNARLKELRSTNNNDLEAQEQANNLYIDSIKAKLSLLDNMN